MYTQILWVLRLVYPTARKGGKTSYIGEFKIYKPDIFIPEIKTCIEYKLVQEGVNIEKHIDDIKMDSDNYIDDIRYDTFYAVIVIKDHKIATKANIKEAWKTKKFPSNWHLIITGDE